jgi:hypothetical protein
LRGNLGRLQRKEKNRAKNKVDVGKHKTWAGCKKGGVNREHLLTWGVLPKKHTNYDVEKYCLKTI